MPEKKTSPKASYMAAHVGPRRVMPRRAKGKLSHRKGGTQGSPKRPAVRYLHLPLIDTKLLRYLGEQADRRAAIQWFYRAMGSPPPEMWDSIRHGGGDGTVAIICNRMGLDFERHRKMVKNTLALIEAGGDVTRRKQHERPEAQRLSKVEHDIVADCLTDGFGLGQATANVNAHRWRKEKKKKSRDLLKFIALQLYLYCIHVPVVS